MDRDGGKKNTPLSGVLAVPRSRAASVGRRSGCVEGFVRPFVSDK